MKMRVNVMGIAAAVVALVGFSGTADATVTAFPATQPGDTTANFNFFNSLTIPPGGAFDERGFSSFQYLISNDGGDALDMGDQFITFGEDRKVAGSSLPGDLGGPELSGKTFEFSIQHNYVGLERNFTFALNEMGGGISNTLCWGGGCDQSIPASNKTETLGGVGPITDFNGLQLQVRAQLDQDILNPVADVQITGLSGVDLAPGTTFFDETVTPASPATILFDSPGRQGQWIMADDNDLTLSEWELTGLVTLSRDDLAENDVTALRFKLDLVQDPTLPFGEVKVVPLPGAVWLFGTGLVALLGFGRWRYKQAV